jgi:hypothetical protein
VLRLQNKRNNREDGEKQVWERKTFVRPKLQSEHKGKVEIHAKLQMLVVSGSYTFKKFIIKLFPARKSLDSDITAGDGNFFLQCIENKRRPQ